jgi:multiple sugar transport system ATP-binding protein
MVILGIRPSDFDDASLGRDPGLPTISATATVVEELGSEVHVLFGVDAPPVSSDAVRAAEETEEEGAARLIHDEAERSTFTARVSAASQVRPGEPITLTVDHKAMHVFDPATGDSIGARALVGASS